MSKAERYIELVSDENGYLYDQHALRAVEIAREEIYEWLKEHSQEYVYWMDEEFGKDDLINDLKQAIRNETQNL